MLPLNCSDVQQVNHYILSYNSRQTLECTDRIIFLYAGIFLIQLKKIFRNCFSGYRRPRMTHFFGKRIPFLRIFDLFVINIKLPSYTYIIIIIYSHTNTYQIRNSKYFVTLKNYDEDLPRDKDVTKFTVSVSFVIYILPM